MATTTTHVPSTTTTNSASPSCTTAVPGKYGEVPLNACNSSYNAIPDFIPAVVVATLFGVFTLVHIIEAIIFKKGYAWVLIMGSAWETTAFILHALGAHNQQNVPFATAWQILFLLAPLWINAFVYMTFARMVHVFMPDRKVSFVKASHVSRLFVLADIFSFIVQAIGGVMVSPGVSASVQSTGLHVYEGGIGLQEVFILVFLVLMIAFHIRIRRLNQEKVLLPEEVNLNESNEEDHTSRENTMSCLWLLYALYAVLAFITMRIIYRLVEFTKGLDPSINALPFHEYYFYSLDAFPMMVALLILAVFHPGHFLKGPNSSLRDATREENRIKKAEKKARKQAKKEQKQQDKEATKEQKRMEKEAKRAGP
ncbi:rta1 domain [Trichoderma arundinaceum]|uniref:Rta1 domain n=1 Tax=Trichoderma arundinaceum TaxID=490622 RepID=A0A395NI36_TRIAR|nr:rta1 domain [Trichoderma arundinaceum]